MNDPYSVFEQHATSTREDLSNQHKKSHNLAHQMLRDHTEQIVELETCVSEHGRRLETLEKNAADNHRLLVELDGRVAQIKEGQQVARHLADRVLGAVNNLHNLVENHINAELLEKEKRTKTGIVRYEEVTKRMIRITATIAATLIILVMIYHALKGEPVLSWLPALIGGGH